MFTKKFVKFMGPVRLDLVYNHLLKKPIQGFLLILQASLLDMLQECYTVQSVTNKGCCILLRKLLSQDGEALDFTLNDVCIRVVQISKIVFQMK